MTMPGFTSEDSLYQTSGRYRIVGRVQGSAHGGAMVPQARKIGGSGKVKARLKCYACTRCVPGTDWCWASDCCDLEYVEVEGGVTI